MNTEEKDRIAFFVTEVKFVSTKREDQYVFFVVEVRFLKIEDKDQAAPHAIPLGTLLGSCGPVFVLP